MNTEIKLGEDGPVSWTIPRMILHFVIILPLAVIFLVSCARKNNLMDRARFDALSTTNAVKDLVSTNLSFSEMISAGEFLHELHDHGLLPGESKDSHGALTCDIFPVNLDKVEKYPISRTYHIARSGESGGSFTNNYIVVRRTKESEWQLQKAWRTGSDGKVIEEWPVK